MAITKMMHMKASSKARIDIHLEHSINYILQPKKLGVSNLAGGINCLPEMAYQQMKATKQMFGKTGGRQGYHFVISLKPDEGTPEIMYDIATKFARQAFHGEYEAVVAVHTDRNHLHAHIVINSVNMVTGYKFQYKNGDWKSYFQPITNMLCEEYGLHITPAEYSKEPTNMARPQWEREQVFSKWIEQDARFCALNAESVEHFIFLLEKSGFEVKQEKHIAVKVPGMKRFKRLDTISENFSRESLDAMFKYGEPNKTTMVLHTKSLPIARKATLSPYQKKCYVRMYRLRLADKKRFIYKPAYLYEQIRLFHELQEEYLVVTKYDVKSYAELFRLKCRMEHVDEELCKVQKEVYRDRFSWKRSCKTVEEMELYEASEADYRERLERIKLEKQKNWKELKAVERCLKRDGSLMEAELERMVPVDELVDLETVVRDEIPKNSYHEQVNVTTVESIQNTVVDVAVNEVIADVRADIVVADVRTLETDVDVTEKNIKAVYRESTQKTEEAHRLPDNKADYMRMTVAEKVRCYPFDKQGIDEAFDMVKAYFEKIGMDTSFHSIYEEKKLLTDYYEEQKTEEVLQERMEQIIGRMERMGIDAGKLRDYQAEVLSIAFDFRDMEYYTGFQLFNKVIDRLGIDMDRQSRYEVFDRIYEEEMRDKKIERGGWSR